MLLLQFPEPLSQNGKLLRESRNWSKIVAFLVSAEPKQILNHNILQYLAGLRYQSIRGEIHYSYVFRIRVEKVQNKEKRAEQWWSYA